MQNTYDIKDKKIRAARGLAQTALLVEDQDPSLSSFLLRKAYLYHRQAIEQRDLEIQRLREELNGMRHLKRQPTLVSK